MRWTDVGVECSECAWYSLRSLYLYLMLDEQTAMGIGIGATATATATMPTTTIVGPRRMCRCDNDADIHNNSRIDFTWQRIILAICTSFAMASKHQRHRVCSSNGIPWSKERKSIRFATESDFWDHPIDGIIPGNEGKSLSFYCLWWRRLVVKTSPL